MYVGGLEEEEEEARTIERISQLRQAVQELRAELHRERLSIQQQQRGYAYSREQHRGGAVESSSVTSDIQTQRSQQQQKQRDGSARDEDEDVELEAAQLASFYKRKISEIEAECCAGLARIRDNFNESATRLLDEIVNDDEMMMTKSEDTSEEHLVRSEAYEELRSETNLAF